MGKPFNFGPRVHFHVDEGSLPFVKLMMTEEQIAQSVVSAGKPPAAKLKRKLKPVGKRAAFIKVCNTRRVSFEWAMKNFQMTKQNVNGYLVGIHRDEGIGYTRTATHFQLVMPPGVQLKDSWRE